MPTRLFNPRIAAGLGAAIAVALVGGLFYIGYFSDHHESDCQSYPLQVVLSPSGRLKAEQGQEACASTDQLRTTVTITRATGGVTPEAPATAFLAVTGKALGAMAIGQRALALTLRWEGDDSLVIVHPAGVVPQLPPGEYGGVKVRYAAQPALVK
jgi:hypothetical protein